MSESTAPRPPNLLTAGVLVIALAAVFLAGFQVRDDQPDAVAAGLVSSTTGSTQPTGIVTGGEGTAEGTPDQLTFNATVTNRRDTTTEAVAATNHDVRAVTINLKKNGVEDKDIQTTDLSIKPHYDTSGRTRSLVGYTSTQRVKVLVRNLEKAGVTLGGVTAAAGNAVRVDGLALSLSDQDAVIAEARDAAVKKSKAAAEALAEAAGRDVGELVYVEEVVPQGYRGDFYAQSTFSQPLSAAAAKSLRRGSVPISPGQQEFTVNVEVRWSLG